VPVRARAETLMPDARLVERPNSCLGYSFRMMSGSWRHPTVPPSDVAESGARFTGEWEMRKFMAGGAALLVAATASVAMAGPYATQWALEGSLDVDLIEGNDTNLDFTPASGGPVVIGLIDTGVDYRHPALAGALFENPGEIPGNCVDDDQNGYVDDVHGIRVDVEAFDGALPAPGAPLEDAFAGACTDIGGTISGATCTAPESVREAEGLTEAFAVASTALDGNPLLSVRACPNGLGATRAERVELARGDAIDYWYGHGTMMAGTMAARSGDSMEPASLLDLPAPGGGHLGDHVKIVTCAAGFPGDVDSRDPNVFRIPRGTSEGAVECADYFLDLKARGVNLVAISLSLGMAEQFPMIDGTDIPFVEDALFHPHDEVVEAFDRLELADVVVVAAAHNLFRDIDDTAAHAMYPAAFEHENVIGVGGVNERGVFFGNRGRNTVDVVAPAQRILHPAVGADIALMARLAVDGFAEGAVMSYDFVDFGEGTSQATAYVATAAAIVRANASTAALSAPEVRRLFLSSATPLPSMPWMLILRPAGNANMQAAYWLYLGMFEPTTRTAKQAALSAGSLSGRIARLDRALDCDGYSFTRIVLPVQRTASGAGHALVVAAESYTCANPAAAPSLSVVVTRPDDTTETISLSTSGDGYYAADYVPSVAGTYRFALASSSNDTIAITVAP
jgi:subtilisin family serine protease